MVLAPFAPLTLRKVTYRYYIGMLSFLNEDLAKVSSPTIVAAAGVTYLYATTVRARIDTRVLSLPYRGA